MRNWIRTSEEWSRNYKGIQTYDTYGLMELCEVNRHTIVILCLAILDSCKLNKYILYIMNTITLLVICPRCGQRSFKGTDPHLIFLQKTNLL